jgi:hypothetical protein
LISKKAAWAGGNMNVKIDKRMGAAYREALASLGDPKNIFGALEETTQILLRNLERRIEWKIQDAAARNQRQPVSLTAEMAELERIGRIHATLQDPRLNEYRTGDPDAGARAIVEILRLAREEYGNGKEDSNKEAGKDEAGKDKVSPEEGEGGEGDENSQNPTLQAEAPGIERQSAISNLCVSHGKIRRGSG